MTVLQNRYIIVTMTAGQRLKAKMATDKRKGVMTTEATALQIGLEATTGTVMAFQTNMATIFIEEGVMQAKLFHLRLKCTIIGKVMG